MLTRRDWLRLTGSGLFATMAGCAHQARAAAAPTVPVAGLDQVARRNGGKGWAIWTGRSKTAGWNTDERNGVLSIAKTLCGLAVTRAVAKGKMSLEEPLYHTFPEWAGDENKRRITPRLLLQQTSGLENGGAALYRGVIEDKGRIALNIKVVNPPGTFFRYGASHWEVLGEFLRRKLDQPIEKILRHEVMSPLGIDWPEWRSDIKGQPYLSTGPKLTTDELGKLGRTLAKLLRGENADGFDANAFAAVTRPSAVNPMFGGGLWRNTQAHHGNARAVEVEDCIEPAPAAGFWSGTCLSTRHPADMVGLIGSSGQRLFIWPSHDRVFARLGISRSWKDQPLLDVLA